MRILKIEVVPTKIGEVWKFFVTVGSTNAVTVIVAAFDNGSGALSNVDVNAGFVAVAVATTAEVTVQLPSGASVMFDKPMVLPPLAPVPTVMAAVEPGVQFRVRVAGVLFRKPAG
jgi:hypothetical protein